MLGVCACVCHAPRQSCTTRRNQTPRASAGLDNVPVSGGGDGRGGGGDGGDDGR